MAKIFHCQNSIFLSVSILLLQCLVASDALNGALQSDPCSVLVSGGSSRTNLVKTVYLNCESGALFWNRPVGSLLARFSPLADAMEDTSRQYRLCLRFPEEHSPQVLVQKMVNNVLEEQELNISDTHSSTKLHCTPIAPDRIIHLFLRTRANYSDVNRPSSAGFYYVIEEDPLSMSDKSAPCASCSEAEFLRQHCSSNFVFKGRLLRQLPEGNALEFSVATVLRRPALQTSPVSEVRPKVGLRTATLLSECPQNSEHVPPFHTDLIVVGDAEIGVARLSCFMLLRRFQELSRSSNGRSECELKTE